MLILLDSLFSKCLSLPSTSPTESTSTSGSVSTLSNGLVVVSEGSSAASTVTLTFPNAGSASESLSEEGVALVNKFLAFKSGSDMSTLAINRTIENEGGTPFSALTRSSATLGFTVAPEKAAALVPMLATDCSFEKWDVRDARSVAAVESAEAGESAQIVLTENLFAAAYGPQSPAGRPIYSGASPSLDSIMSFRERAYGLQGAVLAATGVADHAAFCGQVEEALGGSSSSDAASAPDLAYMGGESRVAVPIGCAHVALAFGAPKASVLSSIVEQLFTVVGAEAGISGFSATGIVGVYGSGTDGSAVADAMMTALSSAAKSGDAVKRAKTLAKAEALFALDGGSVALANFMTASVLETQTFGDAAAVVKAYDAVTDAQVASAVTAMLKTNPSLAAVGDIGTVPYQATIAAQFK